MGVFKLRRTRKSGFLRLLPCLIWMGIIFALSSRTGDDLDNWLPFLQQYIPWIQSFDFGHFILYFVLALTFAWLRGPRTLGFGWKLLSVTLCVLYGLTDEFHQWFVPGRTADIMDLLNDGIGAALAMLFLSIPAVSRLYHRLSGAKYY
ncbi:VanZ family protein [Paenibacillus thalictri]|uniref:VanZ family protein n=1 Tax=Paenibacillus thalictri TaxID=2527873 RepID=UPI0023EA5808|nr:VanZ family protein [Paenibacillus thalictri]